MSTRTLIVVGFAFGLVAGTASAQLLPPPRTGAVVPQLGTPTVTCPGSPTDHDRDGDGEDAIRWGGVDCDDCDARRAHGHAEICDNDGFDEDCEPTTFGNRDADGDRFVDARCRNTDSSGRVRAGNDCDDQRSDVHPNQPEVCNGWDDNCDGVIDEGLGQTVYRDGDRDGFGDPRTEQRACGVPSGYVVRGGDCDDANAALRPDAGCPAVCR